MKKNGFTLVELIGIIIVLAIVSILSFSAITNSIKQAEIRKEEQFKVILINATDIYINTNRDSFPELDSRYSWMCITTQVLIDEDYLDPKIEPPKIGTLLDYQIRVEVSDDYSLNYEVGLEGSLRCGLPDV